MGSNTAEDYILLMVIKFCSTTSFRAKVKVLVPCHKFLQHVEEPYRYEKILGKVHALLPDVCSLFPKNSGG
jgi:hypothetical protein